MNRLIIGRRVWFDAMVDQQGWNGFERRPDVDGPALEAILRRVLGPGLRVARTRGGVAGQMYRVQAAGRVLYVRIAEEAHEDLSVDAALLEHLRAEGLQVPPVVHVEPFDQALGRSVLIMGEIAGEPLAQCRDERAARRVARAAGRELAVLNGVVVDGFGWVQRRAPVWPLRATARDYAEFVATYLPDPWPGPLFDLGHFLLHDQKRPPIPLVEDVIAGYGEVVALPDGHQELVRRSGILLGLRQLARWLGPFRNLCADHPAAIGRAAQLRRSLVAP
jgi:hypothetical protein